MREGHESPQRRPFRDARTLLFGGLESISHNINRKAENLRFYEFGNVYQRDPEKESTVEKPLAPTARTCSSACG